MNGNLNIKKNSEGFQEEHGMTLISSGSTEKMKVRFWPNIVLKSKDATAVDLVQNCSDNWNY